MFQAFGVNLYKYEYKVHKSPHACYIQIPAAFQKT